MEEMDGRKSWSELPPEILFAIGKRLESRVDFFHFRSVCKNWRFSQNPNPNILSSILPLEISNPTLPFSTRPDDSLILISRTVLLVKPLEDQNSKRWILSVEEFNPGKLRILHPLSKDRVTNLSPNFPKYVSLIEFDVFELSKGYGFRYSSDESDVSGVAKVVLCSDSCTAMVLYGKGTLVGMRLKNGNWGYVRQSFVSLFSDVISFKEMIYAIDFEENVYVVDHKTMKVVKTIAANSSHCHRYLVELRGELYSVCWFKDWQKMVKVECNSLDEKKGSWVYTVPKSAIIFISCHSCFTLDFIHPYESVVYSEHSLDSYATPLHTKNKLFGAASEYLHLSIYLFNRSGGSSDNVTIKSIAYMLWPLPAWFWPDTYSSSGDEEEEDVDFSTKKFVTRKMSASSNMQVVEQAQVSSFKNASGMNFEGLNIKPSLVPTLQKICSKHGNLMEKCTFQNKEMISKALESLATVVLILKGNTGLSLSEPQAVYLRSAVSDLQQMNFKVAWLIPFVERALAVHKCRPLVGSLKDFAKVIAQAQEMKLKVLDEVAKLDEVEEDLPLVLEKIPALEEVDLNKCLGEGLY